ETAVTRILSYITYCSVSILLILIIYFFFFHDTTTTHLYTLSLHDALPIYAEIDSIILNGVDYIVNLHHEKKSGKPSAIIKLRNRSEEHTSELQSRENLVCRLLLEKKKTKIALNNIAARIQNSIK